jgi:hypothetical protein
MEHATLYTHEAEEKNVVVSVGCVLLTQVSIASMYLRKEECDAELS